MEEIRNELVQFTVADNDFPQNWVYYIANVDRSHDGVYTAHVSCKWVLIRHFERHVYMSTKISIILKLAKALKLMKGISYYKLQVRFAFQSCRSVPQHTHSRYSLQNNCYLLCHVTHAERCLPEVNSGIQWQQALESTIVSMPCSDAGSMFRDGPVATRKCNESGQWEDADLTSCTLVKLNEPFLLTWFVLDTDMYTDAMEETFVQSVGHQLSALHPLF